MHTNSFFESFALLILLTYFVWNGTEAGNETLTTNFLREHREKTEASNETLPTNFRRGRWGMFFTFEPICSLACKTNGKYSGRMHGGVCRCYCVRREKLPCTGVYPSCDRLCRQYNYELGGDCLDDTTCFCNCTVRQRQSPNGTEPSTTVAPCATTAGPPSGGGSANVPSPGSLGQTRKETRKKKRKPRFNRFGVDLVDDNILKRPTFYEDDLMFARLSKDRI